MRLLTISLILLSGCGAPAPYRQSEATSPLERALIECDYEATKATANIRNGFEAGWMKGDIRRQCMKAKGFTK